MTIGAFRSYAKINLHLQIIGRRADGFHELRTLFQTIGLHDLLRLETADDGISLTVLEGSVPDDSRNLAFQAAEAYFERWPPASGLHLELRKRIPVGGGLGGGSSNAATVLLALDRHFGRATPAGLWEVARELGADVPFFLVGGTALGFGRGDEVIPLDDGPETEIWIVTPPVSISTAEAFGRLPDLTAKPLGFSILALAQGESDLGAAAVAGRNDLERMVLDWVPLLRGVYNSLFDAGANIVRLSGTGASFFALFDKTTSIRELKALLPVGTKVLRTRTLGRVDSVSCRISLGDWTDAGDRDQGLSG